MSFSEAPFNIINRHKVIAYDNTIKTLVWTTLYKHGEGCDLNFIDTSHVRDMSYMFADSKFNKDISGWNVSRVKQFERMFSGNQYFNHDLSKWNPVNAINMIGMFENSVYDKNLILWTTKMFNAETYKMFLNSNVPGDVIDMFHHGINIEKEKYLKNLISAI